MSESNAVSKSAIMVAKIKGKIASIIGWPVTLFFGFIVIAALFTINDEGAVYALIFSLICLFIGIVLIIYGKRTKDRIRRFKRYIDIISNQNETNIDNIAGIISQPVDFVMRDIQSMIFKKFFVGAYLDVNAHVIEFKKLANNVPVQAPQNNAAQLEMLTVVCNGCGACNQIVKGSVGECEYCGSPISGK